MKKIAILAALAALIAAYFWFDLGSELTVEGIKARVDQAQAFYQENALAVLAIFFLTYVAVTAASLPGAAPSRLVSPEESRRRGTKTLFGNTFSHLEMFLLILLAYIYIDMNSCSNCYNSITILSYIFLLKE